MSFFFSLCCGKVSTIDDTPPVAVIPNNNTRNTNELIIKQNQQQQRRVARTFDNSFVLTGRILGQGAFSKVKEVRYRTNLTDNNHNKNNDKVKEKLSYAVKIVRKSKLRYDEFIAIKQEISILKQVLDHPNIITLYHVFDEPKYYYLVTEMMAGGQLFDRIIERRCYKEREARDVCRVLFEAVEYCHARHIAHRDLKPENLLLMSQDNDLDIKIADFGFAKIATSDYSLLTQCGTPTYVAPEILYALPYGTKVDMWSLGVIMYTLLAGYPPFYGENKSELFTFIKQGQYEFHEEHWSKISEDAKDLIAKLLTVDPKRRISASAALKSSWLQREDLECDLGSNLEQLKKFNARRKLKQAIFTVMATNRFLKASSLDKDETTQCTCSTSSSSGSSSNGQR